MINNNYRFGNGSPLSDLSDSDVETKKRKKIHENKNLIVQLPFANSNSRHGNGAIHSISDKQITVLNKAPFVPTQFHASSSRCFSAPLGVHEQGHNKRAHGQLEDSRTEMRPIPLNKLSTSSNSVPNHNEESAILEASLQMMNDRTTSDVTFLVEGQTFYAHRFLISQCSRLFNEMLSKVKDESIIEIQDCSKETFESLLSFIYTGKIDLNEDNLIEICAAYRQFGLFRLTGLNKAFNEYFSKNISIQNALSFLIKSQIKLPDCYRRILSFILKTPAFFNRNNLSCLPKDIFLEILQLDQLSLSEIEVMETVIAWLELQPKNADLLSAIKKHIRFTCMDLQTIWERVDRAQVHGERLCTQAELVAISEKIGRNDIESKREVNRDWLIPTSTELFDLKESKTNEWIVSWKIPVDFKSNLIIDSPQFCLNETVSKIHIYLPLTNPTSNGSVKFIPLNNSDYKLAVETCFVNGNPDLHKYLPFMLFKSENLSISEGSVFTSPLVPNSGFINDNHCWMQFKIKVLSTN